MQQKDEFLTTTRLRLKLLEKTNHMWPGLCRHFVLPGSELCILATWQANISGLAGTS